jgi:flagellar hook-associated protein 1 FlgK
MSGLFSILGSAATALDAQSQAISVASNNIANVNNPEYSKEVASYKTLGSIYTPQGPQSMGITVNVEQERSAVLDQMVQQEASLTSGLTAQQNILQQAQSALGENITNSSTSSSSVSSVSTSGLSAAIDDFFNAFQALAANPTDSGQVQTVVQQAGVLTDRFQEVDQNLSQVQAAAESEAGSDVDSANQLLKQVAQLNKQIAAQESGNPGSALALRDQRQGALEKLAALIPISVKEDSTGMDQVSTTDTSGNSVALVSGVTVTNPLSYAAGAVSAGSTALGLSSGSIQGELSAGSGAVQSLRTSLDNLANQIVTSVNGAYNPSATAGGNFFLADGTTAGAISVDPNLTASTLVAGTGSAGDNSIATAVAKVADKAFSTVGGDLIDGTIGSFYGTVVSDIGQALDTVNTQVTDQTAVQTTVVNQRQSVSGVSVDEEMSNLMSYQRAFQASSEVFQVVDTLLANLVNSLGTVGG